MSSHNRPLEPRESGDSATRPIGRRQRKARAVRHALIEAALTAFNRQPIGLVSVLDITEAADVAKGVFYLHFRSKDEFLLAIWELVHDTLLERAKLAVNAPVPGGDRIETIVGSFYDSIVSDPRHARFCLRMMSYLPDEVGPPGRLTELRRNYIERLGQFLLPGGENSDAAGHLDALIWASIWRVMRMNEPLPERRDFVARIRRALSG